MKNYKNQSQAEREEVKVNAASGNIEKMKCIKNARTNKVQRVRKAVAEQIIADNADWHYTTKAAYERTLNDAIPAGPSVHPEFIKRGSRKPKGQVRNKVEKQKITIVTVNPEYKFTDDEEVDNRQAIVNKPRKSVVHVGETHQFAGISGNETATNIEVETTITKKVPANDVLPKVIAYKRTPKFITTFKYVYHLIVGGQRVKPLVEKPKDLE